LKGLINFYKVHHFGICVPLMTIIGTAAVDYSRCMPPGTRTNLHNISHYSQDYRGFRLVAQALLPIGDDTLVYGSSDAGVNVRTDSREVSATSSFFVL